MSKALEIVKNLSEEVDEDAILKELIDAFGADNEEEIRGSFNTEGRYGSFGDAGEFTSDGVEYNWISNEEEAERIALEIVMNDLETEPEIFNQDWLQGFLSISETDKRVIANEMADSEAEGQEFENDEEKESWIENRTDEMESKLDDPIGYFVDEQGMYSIEDLMKQPWISIDIDSASENALKSDGVGHFIALYDGELHETENGVIYFRE